MYAVVTDTDVTSKDVLKKGQLQQHTTLLPMNKLNRPEMHPSIIKNAQNLVGKENVSTAMSLIQYDPQYHVVMKYCFGRTLVCNNMDTAKKVSFIYQIETVTLQFYKQRISF